MSISGQRSQIEAEREERACSSAARKVVYVLHPAAFAHDFFGLYLLNELGPRIGLTVGGFEIVSDRNAAPDSQDVGELIGMGIIPICVAGPFAKEDPDAEHNSVTVKIARQVGADKDPVWLRLVRWVQGDHESPGPGNWQRTLGMFRTLSLSYSHDQERAYSVFESVIDAVRAELMEEIDAKRDLEEATRGRITLIRYRGRDIRIGVVESDNDLIVRAARHTYKLDVVIKKDSSGRGLVSAASSIDLSLAAGLIRTEEARLAGETAPTDAAKIGVIETSDRWYYDCKPSDGFQALINGGPTSPNTVPTQLSSKMLTSLVVDGLAGF